MIFSAENFHLAEGITQVQFSDRALTQLASNRQMKPYQSETGGQLFARFESGNAVIELATGPHKGSKAGRFWFRGNRKREKAEIKAMFKKGFHYVGDWHSHPEPIPSPSSQDWNTHKSLVAKSKYELNGLLMVILGQREPPIGLSVNFATIKGKKSTLSWISF